MKNNLQRIIIRKIKSEWHIISFYIVVETHNLKVIRHKFADNKKYFFE